MIIEGLLKEERTGRPFMRESRCASVSSPLGKIPSEEDLSSCIYLFLERMLQGRICFSCLMEASSRHRARGTGSLDPHSS